MTDPKIVADVTQRAKGKRVVVILDSLHTTEHVLAELRAYWPLVGVGSYIIVQDTVVGRGLPRGERPLRHRQGTRAALGHQQPERLPQARQVTQTQLPMPDAKGLG